MSNQHNKDKSDGQNGGCARAISKQCTPRQGVGTTGHQWDGIEEYNNPDPFWLRAAFYIALFFALIYWIIYPSWPTPNNTGLLNWSSVKALLESQKEVDAMRSKYQASFDKATFDEILNDQNLLKFALAGGKSAFENNCAPCHGVGGGGAPGYPNLAAGSWLWGGKIDDIYTTIKYGIRSGHEETRESQMAAFGADKMLTAQQIDILAKRLLMTEWSSDDESAKLFAENCAACHGKDGAGGREFGAPNLRDAIWLYGGDYKTIFDVIYNGRSGVMPYWTGKLQDSVIRQLAIYVHELGGGE